MQQSRAGAGAGTEARPQRGGSQFLVAVGWLRQLLASPAMVLPLPWLSRSCCRRLLLPPWPPALQGSWRCCSQGPKASTEKTSSTGAGQMSPSRVSGTKSEGGGQMCTGGRESPPISPCTTGQLSADTTPTPRACCLVPQFPSTLPAPTPLQTSGHPLPTPLPPCTVHEVLEQEFPLIQQLIISQGGLGQPVLPFPYVTQKSSYSPWAVISNFPPPPRPMPKTGSNTDVLLLRSRVLQASQYR